jgi:outer membrane lipoprotein-sorting protein
MTSWRRTPRVPASTFAFQVPAGVRIVDQAAFGGAR